LETVIEFGCHARQKSVRGRVIAQLLKLAPLDFANCALTG
jgi:hypothetical protein